jgi:flagellar protein FliS
VATTNKNHCRNNGWISKTEGAKLVAATKRQDEYFASKVLTAPAHKLHLTLIEGAIRFGRQAEAAMQSGDFAAASEPLLRVIEIVGELLAGVRERQTELNEKIADLYLFLFRTASEAKINDDVAKLSEALRLLEFERETWQLVCDKYGSESLNAPLNGDSVVHGEQPRLPIAPPLNDNGSMLPGLSSLSLEA